MRTSFLFNSSDHINLKSAFEGQLQGAKSILILVGFVMKSGADELIRLCRKERILPNNVTIITGLSFGITEPQALRCLLEKKFTLRLFNGKKIFHPKIYIFQKKATSSVLIGSANLSWPALTNSIEAATLLTLPAGTAVLRSLMKFWDDIRAQSIPATMENIREYESKRIPRPYNEPRVNALKKKQKGNRVQGGLPPVRHRNKSKLTKWLEDEGIVKNRPGHITFKGKRFGLTGKFQHGLRKYCAKEIRDRGGQVEPFNVTKNTDFLVIGSHGSPHWLMKTHGKKMARAAKYRQETGRPLIISEEQWEKALS